MSSYFFKLGTMSALVAMSTMAMGQTAAMPAQQTVPRVQGTAPLLPPIVPAGPVANSLSKTAAATAGTSTPLMPTPVVAPIPQSPDTRVQPSAFMSQTDIARRRAACQVGFAGESRFLAKPAGDEFVVNFTRKSGQGCLTAVSAENTWVDADLDINNDRVILTVEENPSAQERVTQVYVVTPSQSYVLKVRQQAGAPKTAPTDNKERNPAPATPAATSNTETAEPSTAPANSPESTK